MSGPGLVHLLLLHLEGAQVNWQGKTEKCMFTIVCVCVSVSLCGSGSGSGCF